MKTRATSTNPPARAARAPLQLAKAFGRFGLVLLLSSLLPTLGLPLPRAHAAPKAEVVRVDAKTFVCQTAKFTQAMMRTMVPVWQSLGVATDELVAGASQYTTSACATNATGAKAKVGLAAFKSATEKAVGAYAKKFGLTNKEATRRLWLAQLAFLQHAFSCGRAKPQNVSKFLRGIDVGPIDLVGAPLMSGSGINPISASQLGTCGGSGGGGGGGPRDMTMPLNVDPASYETCMKHFTPVSEGCGFVGQDAEKAQSSADDAQSKDEDEKEYNAKVEMKDGTVTVTGRDGSKLVIEKVPNDQADDWAEIAIEAFAVLTAVGSAVSVTLAAPAVATALAGISAVLALIVLLKHVREEMDEKPYNIVINPRLCPIQIGDRVAWVTNPQTGNALGEFDSFSVCTCSAGKDKPARCNSSGQKQIDKMTACQGNPYALYVDQPLCKDNVVSSNPWLTYNIADQAACAYKDCGPFAAGGISGGGCSCSSSNPPGGPHIPRDLVVDPNPIDIIIGNPGGGIIGNPWGPLP